MSKIDSIYAASYQKLDPRMKQKWRLSEYVEFCENWDKIRKIILGVEK